MADNNNPDPGTPIDGGRALIRSLELEGRRGDLRPARRSDPAGVRPDHRQPDPPHPRAPRAGRRPHGRGLRPCHRPSRRRDGHLAARRRPTSSRRCATPTWTRSRWSSSPARLPTARSAPTRSRSATPSASPARSPSTTSSSPAPRTSRGSIREAFHIATTGRPGPVLVDIPKDIVDPTNPNSAMELVLADRRRGGCRAARATSRPRRATPRRSTRRPS